jgi:hypothetical protein
VARRRPDVAVLAHTVDRALASVGERVNSRVFRPRRRAGIEWVAVGQRRTGHGGGPPGHERAARQQERGGDEQETGVWDHDGTGVWRARHLEPVAGRLRLVRALAIGTLRSGTHANREGHATDSVAGKAENVWRAGLWLFTPRSRPSRPRRATAGRP